jgi:hypothetical protein
MAYSAKPPLERYNEPAACERHIMSKCVSDARLGTVVEHSVAHGPAFNFLPHRIDDA